MELEGVGKTKGFSLASLVYALRTNYFWFARHISIDPNFSLYSLYEHETALHVLRNCPIALDFWHRLVDPMLYPYFYTSSLRSWWSWNLQNSVSFLGHSWYVIFAIAIHYLWRVRSRDFLFAYPFQG